MNKRQRKQARVKAIIKKEYLEVLQERAIEEDLKAFYRPLTNRRV